MEKILSTLFIVTMLAIIYSCSEPANGEEPPEPIPARALQINSCMTIENENVNENLLSPIGLLVTTTDGNPYNEESYKTYATLTHSQWIIQSPVYITGQGLVRAYYPYEASAALPILEIDLKNQVDLLYQKSPIGIDAGSEGVNIELSHALSQVNVNVEYEDVASLSLHAPVKSNFNIITGAFNDMQYGEVTAQGGQLLLIPHSLDNADLIITLKNGESYTYSLSSVTYNSGENYTYSFQLNKYREKLEIISITIKDWVTGFIHQDYLR